MMEELLHILEKNARLPVEDIAAMMGKTPAQVATMMDEAVAKGYIRGFEAMIDWEQAGINVVEAVIELHVSPRKSRGFDEIASVIASFDEVDSVLLMSGSYDLQVVIKGHSFQEIALFVAKRLSPLDDVLSTATSFVLRPYKRGGKLYLIVQTADTRTFFQFDFGATLFLNLFAHNSAPFRGWILNRQKRKISLPYWGTENFLFFQKSNKNADFLRKMENECAFWQNRKTALPQQHSAATHNFVLWGKAVFLIFPKSIKYTIWRGT